ncbi:hypothetical protein ACSBR2_012407 [Camellia fascicularis]
MAAVNCTVMGKAGFEFHAETVLGIGPLSHGSGTLKIDLKNSHLSLKNKFEQFQVYEANFGFLFDLKKCNDESLKAGCVNIEEFLKHDEISDIDRRHLLMKLKVLNERLPKEVNKPIEVFNHLQLIAICFPNSWVA